MAPNCSLHTTRLLRRQLLVNMIRCTHWQTLGFLLTHLQGLSGGQLDKITPCVALSMIA